MKICPNCGGRNPDSNIKCDYCDLCFIDKKKKVNTNISISDIKNNAEEKKKRAKEIEEKLDEVFKTILVTEENSVFTNELTKYRDKLQHEYAQLTGHYYYKPLLSIKFSEMTCKDKISFILQFVGVGVVILAMLACMIVGMRG